MPLNNVIIFFYFPFQILRKPDFILNRHRQLVPILNLGCPRLIYISPNSTEENISIPLNNLFLNDMNFVKKRGMGVQNNKAFQTTYICNS